MPDLDFIHRLEPGTTAGAPTLLLLHGTGGNESDLLRVGRRLTPEGALLSPRGKVLERGMPRFFRRLAEGVFDLEDLRNRTHELASFVVAAVAAYGLEPRSVIAVGYSNGANIAASMLLLRPGLLAGGIFFRPMVPLEPTPLPDLGGVPVFIAAGRTDLLVAPGESERLAALLEQAGAEVTLHWHAGDHALTADDVRAAQAWLSGRAWTGEST